MYIYVIHVILTLILKMVVYEEKIIYVGIVYLLFFKMADIYLTRDSLTYHIRLRDTHPIRDWIKKITYNSS